MSTATPTGNSPTGEKPKKEDRLHTFHRHGDLSIRSTDGIIFKVNSGRLAEVSTVFKDMMEVGMQGVVPPVSIPSTRFTSNIIDIGFPSSTLETFFDMVCTPRPGSIWADYQDSLVLYQFCEQFDIESRFQHKVEICLFDKAKEHFQWDLLIWSAERDDTKMARNAVSLMTGEDFLCARIFNATKNDKKEHLNFWLAMDKLPLSWQNQLIHRCFTSPYGPDYQFKFNPHGAHHRLNTCTDWLRLAKDFNP